MKRIFTTFLIAAAFSILVLPLGIQAASVFQEIDSYTSFSMHLDGQWRNYEYSDLGINESFKCDEDSPLFDVALQKKGFLGTVSTIGAYKNRPTNTGVRYCYRWVGANANGGEFRYCFDAHDFTAYRYYVYDTITLVSEQ